MAKQKEGAGAQRNKELRARWTEFLDKNNLNTTQQREVIVDTFLCIEDHATADDLLARVRKRYAKIGYATVYRTLRLLVDSGVAMARQFNDGQTSYEVAGEHHDHWICVQCDFIIEFENEEIERIQEEVATELGGLNVLRHKHELYGLCPKAQGIAGGACPNES